MKIKQSAKQEIKQLNEFLILKGETVQDEIMMQKLREVIETHNAMCCSRDCNDKCPLYKEVMKTSELHLDISYSICDLLEEISITIE